MASQMMLVGQQVNETTAAVVGMHSAVVAAEINSANEICANVNRGFFTLVRSQISQKIAQKQSRVEALIMKMAQQKRLLLNVKATMEREYGRIAARYLTLFSRINKDLEQRIRQVDQPVFELVNRHMSSASNRMNALSSWMLTSQQECLATSQQMLMSNLKHHAQQALQQSSQFLETCERQREVAQQILTSQTSSDVQTERYVPVGILETIADASGVAQTQVQLPRIFCNSVQQLVNNHVRSNNSFAWKANKAEQQRTDEAFARLLQQTQLPERVRTEILRLRNTHTYESL